MRAGHFVHDDLLEHIEMFILFSHILPMAHWLRRPLLPCFGRTHQRIR